MQAGETTVRCKARHTDRNASRGAQGGVKMDTGDGNTIQYNAIIGKEIQLSAFDKK